MTRANRIFLPGYVWHLTHQCHKRAFLLKFAKDKQTWCHWLFEAKKRYGLRVLNYTITSNHIHLLVYDTKGERNLSRSLQLISGQTAQRYNQRKKRHGAFWEDRYHATAMESGEHLMRCIGYIDLNMVRAGVVNHPKEWSYGGYSEFYNPPKRYHLVNIQEVLLLTGMRSLLS